MNTDFERIPPLFVELYRPQFEIWAREFRVRGARCAIVFRRPPGVVPLLDVAGRTIQKGVWLEAEVDRSMGDVHVTIRPASDHDEELIEKHVREMRPFVLQ